MKKYDEMLEALKRHWSEIDQEEIKKEVYGTYAIIYKDFYVTMENYVTKKILENYKEIIDIKEKAAAAYWILSNSDELDIRGLKNEFIYDLALAAGVAEKREIVSDDPIA